MSDPTIPLRIPEPEPATSPGPLLISAARAAEMCGVSTATWWRWDSSGRVPPAVRIGGTTRWRMSELTTWTAAGCPRREEWMATHQID